MTAPKTPAERVFKSEEIKRNKGLKKLWVWAYPDSMAKIRTYAKLLEKGEEEKLSE